MVTAWQQCDDSAGVTSVVYVVKVRGWHCDDDMAVPVRCSMAQTYARNMDAATHRSYVDIGHLTNP